MFRISFFVCLTILFSTLSKGQHSKIDICEVTKKAKEELKVDTINQLLQIHDTNQITSFERAELLAFRAWLTLRIKNDEMKMSPQNKDRILSEVNQDFNQAVKVVRNENDKLIFRYRRFYVMEQIDPNYKNYDSDLSLLKTQGFKEDKFGLAFFATSRYDGELWLGGELAIFSGLGPRFKLKDNDGSIVAKNNLTKAASFLTLGYARNVQSEMEDFSVSLIRIEAPLFIDIFKLGFVNTPDQTNWFYRPEIGVGYSIFQLSVGYNLFFKKDGRDRFQKLFTTLRGKFIF